jgi:hypothetical protein
METAKTKPRFSHSCENLCRHERFRDLGLIAGPSGDDILGGDKCLSFHCLQDLDESQSLAESHYQEINIPEIQEEKRKIRSTTQGAHIHTLLRDRESERAIQRERERERESEKSKP